MGAKLTSLFDLSFMVFLTEMFVAGILYILFGEITVSRLRKNPVTKEALGLDVVSGKDIVNVAMALSVPRKLNRKVRGSKISFMFADADVLYRYTSRFDRVLARVFYWTFFTSGVGFILMMILHALKII